MNYFSTYQYSYQAGGIMKAFRADWVPNIVAYTNDDENVIALNKTLQFEELPCGVNLAANEDYSTNSNGSFLYNAQLQLDLAGMPRHIIPHFDGKRTIVIIKTSTLKYYIYGLDTGLRLQSYTATTGSDTAETNTQLRLANNQRVEFLECTPEFVEDVIIGGLVTAPQNLNITQ